MKTINDNHKVLCDIFYDRYLYGISPKQKCAVKVNATGEHCPEIGMHKIDDTDEYLCERCYTNWIYHYKNYKV